MARFYQPNRHYLLGQDAKNYFIAVFLVLLPLLLIWIITEQFNSGAVTIFFALGLIALLLLSEPVRKYFLGRSNKFYRGWVGEREVRRALRDLPDTYAVFSDLLFPGHKANIDFVVVGPAGVYILEVKSHNGAVEFNGRELTINGKSYSSKYFLQQTYTQMRRLKDFLYAKTGQQVYIYPTIVFTGTYAKVRFGFKPVNGIYVIQKEFLMNLFHEFPPRGNVPQRQVEQALAALMSNK